MEPPLFPRFACDEEACAASAAVARPANVPKQNVSPSDDKNEADQQYPSDRALLLSLPVEILHAIISLISLTERPTLLQLSHKFTSVVTHPAFLLSRRASGASDEILFLVGARTRYASAGEGTILGTIMTKTATTKKQSTPPSCVYAGWASEITFPAAYGDTFPLSRAGACSEGTLAVTSTILWSTLWIQNLCTFLPRTIIYSYLVASIISSAKRSIE